jgi:hypothetical protein
VGGLGQVLIDGVKVHCPLLAPLGGGVGELLFQAEHQGADISGVEYSNDRFRAI